MHFFWYDFETSGRDPRFDRPIQLGAQLTDQSFEPDGEPLSTYIRLPDDVLPSPMAMQVHQIPPDVHQREGMSEAELGALWMDSMAPRMTIAGYNSRAFDDRFVQHLLYRCLRDPYGWQYLEGRQRFDLYPAVLAYFVLQPSVLHWPTDPDGKPRFKLDRLGPLNGLDHGIRAHDAVGDVLMTARLARLMQTKDPDLFAHCLRACDKDDVIDQIRAVGRSCGLLWVTPFAGYDKGYCRDLWVPFKRDAKGSEYVGFDLSVPPADVLAALKLQCESGTPHGSPLSAASLGIHRIRANRQPMLFRRDRIDATTAARLQDFGRHAELQALHLQQWQAMLDTPQFSQLYRDVLSLWQDSESMSGPQDVDAMLYSSGFLSSHDRSLLVSCPHMDPDALSRWTPDFEDSRYPELLFRYRARNFPKSLSPAEWRQWQQTRRKKLLDPDASGMSLTRLQQELLVLAETPLEPHHFDQLQRFSTWLDNQPPI